MIPFPGDRPGRTTVRATTAARAVALAAATAAALALGACSGLAPSRPAPSGSASTTPPVVAPTISPTQPQHPIPSDNQIVEDPDLRNTIAMTGCAAVDGGWAGTGTAKNPETVVETYRILVFFTDRYSRTIDSATTDVTVQPGQTAKWTAATSFTPPDGTQCVLRGLAKI